MKALLSPTDLASLKECREIFISAWFDQAIKQIDLKENLMWLARRIMWEQQDIFRACGFPSQAAMMAGYDDRDPEE